ncbi:MAG: hypothetical protein AAF570_12180 [Bacteroidota bacterium]
MQYKQISLLFLLIFNGACLFAQETEQTKPPLIFSIKTNPLQYIFREFNLSLEFQKGQNGVEAKVSRVASNPALFLFPFGNYAVYGVGAKGHLMYRRYTKDQIFFVGLGLMYKYWEFGPRELYYVDAEYECALESRYAHALGSKWLMGVKVNLAKGRILTEYFAGMGLRYRWGETTRYAIGGTLSICDMPLNPADTRPYSGEVLGGFYLGVNLGLNIGRSESTIR